MTLSDPDSVDKVIVSTAKRRTRQHRVTLGDKFDHLKLTRSTIDTDANKARPNSVK